MYSRILIAIDGSELAVKGLEKGLELAGQLGAKVDIVTVSEPIILGAYDSIGWSAGYESGDDYKKGREAAAQKILQPALEVASAAGVSAHAHHVLDRYAADGIIDTATACGSDLLVMTSHGRRGVSRVLLGSQTNEVLARSTLPVLVIR